MNEKKANLIATLESIKKRHEELCTAKEEFDSFCCTMRKTTEKEIKKPDELKEPQEPQRPKSVLRPYKIDFSFSEFFQFLFYIIISLLFVWATVWAWAMLAGFVWRQLLVRKILIVVTILVLLIYFLARIIAFVKAQKQFLKKKREYKNYCQKEKEYEIQKNEYEIQKKEYEEKCRAFYRACDERRKKEKQEVEEIINKKKEEYLAKKAQFDNEVKELFEAEGVKTWYTIYDDLGRIIFLLKTDKANTLKMAVKIVKEENEERDEARRIRREIEAQCDSCMRRSFCVQRNGRANCPNYLPRCY